MARRVKAADAYHNPGKGADAELQEILGDMWDKPLEYVMFMFPWDTDETIQLVELAPEYKARFGCKYGPDKWACEFLDDWGDQIRASNFDGHNSVPPLKFATGSGHGIGKSTLTAWIIKFLMDTRPGSMGTVTANTDVQLRTKTWAELGKWHNMSLTKHWFKYNSGRGNMSLKALPEYAGEPGPDRWACTAQTCREENSESFAGQHAPTATSFYIFDEAGGIPDKIFEVREGGTTDGEPMIFDFGNPTRNTGMFFENCVGRFKHNYTVRCIDSRSCVLPNKERIERWRSDYGEESDFFKVRVRGQFPALGSAQFISTEDVQRAMNRMTPSFDQIAHQPLVLGVDCARYGDDESVIYPRQGIDARSWPARRYRELDTWQLTNRIVECFNDFAAIGKRPAMIFVDQGNFGVAIVDNLRHLGYPVIGVDFGKAAKDGVHKYEGDRIWGELKSALVDGLVLPDIGEQKTDMEIQMTQREYGYMSERIHLETKKDMKERLGADVASSPDLVDALAVTYYQPIALMAPNTKTQPLRNMQDGPKEPKGPLNDYDPLDTNF